MVNVNTVLATLPSADIDESTMSSFEAQTKFIRAYLYFILVQHFGDVILITEPINEPAAAWTYFRAPAADVYNLIKKTLLQLYHCFLQLKKALQ